MNPNRRADASRAGPADSKFDSAAESSALVVNKNIADTGSDLLRRAFGPSFNERQGATQTDEVQPRASEPPHEFEPLNKAAAIITQDGQPHVFQPADEDTVQPSEVVDRQQPAVPEPGNDNMQPKSTGEENEQAQTSNTNEQGDTLMADEFASEPTLGVGEIPPKYTSRESRIKLLRSSLKKSTPTREELRMDLLHYFSTSFISGEITGTFQEHLSRATFNEKKNALKRAGGRRRRAMKQLRKRKDSGRELNMWPPRSNNRDGPSNEDSLV